MARYKTDLPYYLFHHGINCYAHDVLGAFYSKKGRGVGYRFRVWAPDAVSVSVVGEFNVYDPTKHLMTNTADPEIWEIFIPKVIAGQLYRYAITTHKGELLFRPDPYCREGMMVEDKLFSITPSTEEYHWQDGEYLEKRKLQPLVNRPLNIYSVDLGSWKKDGDGRPLCYEKLGEELSHYLSRMGYTHLHLLPISEYTFKPSWGFCPSLLFAPTRRYGKPEGLKKLVDCCHQKGIGVILEIPTAYFPMEEENLALFDGSDCYEQSSYDYRLPRSFAFSKGEVQSFLLSNCIYFLEEFHIDGLKLEGIDRLLYPEFGRRGERWRPNAFADRNSETAELLRKINTAVGEKYPDVLMIAEDAAPYPGVTMAVERGGLGFHYRSSNDWTADTLQYISLEGIYRSYNHYRLTNTLGYLWEERSLLCCDHNQFVHGRRSLIGRTTGDYWEQFAMVRVFLGYMMAHPGGKFHFMGSEIGQYGEWDFQKSLDWSRLNHTIHQDLQRYVKELNLLYQAESPLWQGIEPHSFRWVMEKNAEENLLIFTRNNEEGKTLLVICNFSETGHRQRRIGVPTLGRYQELMNSDAIHYGGKGNTNPRPILAENHPQDGYPYGLTLNIPPLGCAIFAIEPM